MKNLLFTAFFAFVALTSSAQITLEHTFPGGVNVIKINVTDYRYVTLDTTNNLVSIYNTDYLLDKSITLQRPGGTHYSSQAFVSKNLFNSNNTYQVAVTMFTKKQNSITASYYYIFDDDGSVLWKSPINYPNAAYYNMPTGTKMILTSWESDSQLVYSIAGYYYSSSIKPGGGGNGIGTQVYPNPGADHVFISVKNLNQSASMDITNLGGQVLQQLTMSPGRQIVNVDTRSLPDGVYIYSIRSSGNSETETGKFLVVH